MKKTKTVLYLILFIVFLLALYFAYQTLSKDYLPESTIRPPQESSAPEEQKIAAPDFTVLDNSGNSIKLSDLKGKPIVLNFWASWCPPCKSEMPHFEQVYREMKDEILFMMVDLTDGQRETMEGAKKFIKQEGYTFPVYFDTQQEAAYIYQISSIPTTLFIDKDGYVVYGHQGVLNKNQLKQSIGLIK